MNDLIEALQLFRKYANEKWPTHCEHDEMWIMGVGREMVSDADHKRLDELGFFWSEEDCYKSFRFGSA